MTYSTALWIGDILQIIALLAIVGSAFVGSWFRALVVAVVPISLWSLVRIATILYYEEDSPPMIGFVVAPFLAAIYGSVLRGVRILCVRLLKKVSVIK